jgi:hypothetical protein
VCSLLSCTSEVLSSIQLSENMYLVGLFNDIFIPCMTRQESPPDTSVIRDRLHVWPIYMYQYVLPGLEIILPNYTIFHT